MSLASELQEAVAPELALPLPLHHRPARLALEVRQQRARHAQHQRPPLLAPEELALAAPPPPLGRAERRVEVHLHEVRVALHRHEVVAPPVFEPLGLLALPRSAPRRGLLRARFDERLAHQEAPHRGAGVLHTEPEQLGPRAGGAAHEPRGRAVRITTQERADALERATPLPALQPVAEEALQGDRRPAHSRVRVVRGVQPALRVRERRVQAPPPTPAARQQLQRVLTHATDPARLREPRHAAVAWQRGRARVLHPLPLSRLPGRIPVRGRVVAREA